MILCECVREINVCECTCVCVYVGGGSVKENSSGTVYVQYMNECKPRRVIYCNEQRSEELHLIWLIPLYVHACVDIPMNVYSSTCL